MVQVVPQRGVAIWSESLSGYSFIRITRTNFQVSTLHKILDSETAGIRPRRSLLNSDFIGRLRGPGHNGAMGYGMMTYFCMYNKSLFFRKSSTTASRPFSRRFQSNIRVDGSISYRPNELIYRSTLAQSVATRWTVIDK